MGADILLAAARALLQSAISAIDECNSSGNPEVRCNCVSMARIRAETAMLGLAQLKAILDENGIGDVGR